MAAARTVRMLLMTCALALSGWSLAACSSLPRSLVVRPGETSVFSLISHKGPKLSLRNDSGGHPDKVYSEAADQLAKVIPDAEMQALFDVFTADKLFELSIPAVPGNARDVLRLEQAGQTWYWVRRGSFVDPREQAFNTARSYFLSLYNGSTAYHSGPSSDDGRYPGFLTEEELQRRDRELRRLKSEREKDDVSSRGSWEKRK